MKQPVVHLFNTSVKWTDPSRRRYDVRLWSVPT
jgi:hypothetical protein